METRGADILYVVSFSSRFAQLECCWGQNTKLQRQTRVSLREMVSTLAWSETGNTICTKMERYHCHNGRLAVYCISTVKLDFCLLCQNDEVTFTYTQIHTVSRWSKTLTNNLPLMNKNSYIMLIYTIYKDCQHLCLFTEFSKHLCLFSVSLTIVFCPIYHNVNNIPANGSTSIIRNNSFSEGWRIIK